MQDPNVSLSHDLAKTRSDILELKYHQGRAGSQAELDVINDKLAGKTADLRELVVQASEYVAPPSKFVPLTQEQAQTRFSVVSSDLATLKERRSSASKLLASSSASNKTYYKAMISEIDKEIQQGTSRLKLLQSGVDVDVPVKLPRSNRVALELPAMFVIPARPKLLEIMRTVVQTFPRHPGESIGSYKARIKAYSSRSLGRYLANPQGEVLGAVSTTAKEDYPVVEAEIEAGGLAVDEVVEAVEPAIDDLAQELDQLVADASSMPEETDQLLLEAEGLEQELLISQPSATSPKSSSALKWAVGIIAVGLVLRGILS